MSSQTILELIIGVAVVGLLIFRQMRSRPVRSSGSQRLMVILGIIGLIEAVQFMQQHHAGTAAVVALLGSLVLAAVFGAARAATMRIWMQDGQPWVKGNVLTAVLWIAALAAHLGYDSLIAQHKDIGGIGDATVLLYLAVSLAVQRLIVSARAQRLDPSGSSPFQSGAI